MAIAILVHLAVSTAAALVLGLIAGKISYSVALAALVLGTLSGIAASRRFNKRERLFPGAGFATWVFLAFVLVAAFQHFLYLIYYYDQNGLRTLHPNNFGDLAMHIQYIRNLASGAHFWPSDPGFSGTPLKYPIGMDLYNALWERLGAPLESHLFLTGVVATVVAASLLYHWMRWWGVGAFFLNGGFMNWASAAHLRFQDFQNSAAWKNFLVSVWITQRGFLFALPAGVYIFKTITEWLLGERTVGRDEKVVVALLWAALPWFHLHTFAILTLALLLLAFLYRKPAPVLAVFIPAAATGALFIIFSTSHFPGKVLRYQWGWVAGGQNLFEFWAANLGLFVPLWAATYFLIFREKAYAAYRPIAVVGFGLFFLFTFIIAAPWDWDNIKILLWLYLVIAWLIWRVCISRLSPAVAAVLGCAVFLSGTVSVISSLPGNSPGVELYRTERIWEAKAAITALPHDAVLAVVPRANHPAAYWGASVAMDYPGHIWSHGLPSAERESELDDFFRGDGNWPALAHRMGVTHIYWGEDEKRKYAAFNPEWQYRLKNISRSATVGVYEVP